MKNCIKVFVLLVVMSQLLLSNTSNKNDSSATTINAGISKKTLDNLLQEYQDTVDLLENQLRRTVSIEEELRISAKLNIAKAELINKEQEISSLNEFIKISNSKVTRTVKILLEVDGIDGALAYLRGKGFKQFEENTKKNHKELASGYIITAKLLETKNKYDEAKEEYEKLVGLDRTIQNLFYYADFLRRQNYFNKAVGKYEELFSRIKSDIPENTYFLAKIYTSLAEVYHKRNQYVKAEEMYEKSVVILEKLVKKTPNIENTNTLIRHLNIFALFLSDIKSFDKVEKVYKRALKISRFIQKINKTLSDEHISITLGNLANFYAIIKKDKKERENNRKALKLKRLLVESNASVDHLDSLSVTLDNIGSFYFDRNQWMKARENYEESLAIRKILVKKNPKIYRESVAESLFSLASLYEEMNYLVKAKNLIHESLEIRKELAKENPMVYNPLIANTLIEQALIYGYANEYKEAEESFSKALKIRRSLAKINPNVFNDELGTTLHQFGALYFVTNNVNKAEQFYVEAISLYRGMAKLYPNIYNPKVATIVRSLARLYTKEGKIEEAEKNYIEIVHINEVLALKNSKKYNQNFINSLNELGDFYYNEKLYAKAKKIYIEAEELWFNIENRDTIIDIWRNIEEKLSKLYDKDGQLNKASMAYDSITLMDKDKKNLNFREDIKEEERDYIDALNLYMKLSSQNPKEYKISYITSLKNIEKFYYKYKNFKKAQAYVKILLKLYKQDNKNNSYLREIAHAQYSLAVYLYDNKEFEKSKNEYENVLKKYFILNNTEEKKYTRRVADIYNNLLAIYIRNSEFKKSEKMALKALVIYKTMNEKKIGNYQSKIGMTLRNLSIVYIRSGKYKKAEEIYIQALNIYQKLFQSNFKYHKDVKYFLLKLFEYYHIKKENDNIEKTYLSLITFYRVMAKKTHNNFPVEDTLNELADFYKKTSQFSKVENTYQELIDFYKSLISENKLYKMYQAQTIKTLINLLLEREKYLKAIVQYKELIILYPKNDELYFNIGDIYFFQKDYNKALKFYKQAIEKNLNNDYTHMQMGMTYFWLGKFDESIFSYTQAIKLNPSNSLAYTNLFELQLIQNQSFKQKLEQQYIEQFQKEKEVFISYEMLKILQNISQNKETNIEYWKEKYKNISLADWSFNELESWVAKMEESDKKSKLKETLKIFKNHKKD